MNKEFVPYEEALELKSLEFDEPCFACDKNIRISGIDGCVVNIPIKNSSFTEDDEFVASPTFSQAFRFFRKKYKLQTYIDFYHSESYFFKIKSQDGRYIGNTGDVILQGSPLFTRPYEEAELACLRKLIEIVKNK